MIDGVNNLLDNEEREQLKKALELKRDIISYLNMATFIAKTRDIIDKSECFEFRSIASKLYIDERQPVFILKLKDVNIAQELAKLGEKGRDEVTKMLQYEIIRNISKLLTDCIRDDKSDLFVGIPEEITEFIITNIYVVRANLKDNNIQIYFFV